MLYLGECLKNDTNIYLIKPEDLKKKGLFSIFRKKSEKRIFRKDFNHAELIGEELCNIRNLRCAHYFLVGEGTYQVNRTAPFEDIDGMGYQLKLGSYDFRDLDKYDYFQIEDHHINNDHLDEILDLAPNEKNRKELLDDILEMFALDTFMGQTDRYWNNVIFQKDKETNEIRLAPLFDFEYSLNPCDLDSKMIYGNVLHSFKDENAYIEFIEKYPEFGEKLKFYLDVDLIDTIERGYRVKELAVPKSALPSFADFEKDRKDLIRRVTSKQNIRAK